MKLQSNIMYFSPQKIVIHFYPPPPKQFSNFLPVPQTQA